MALKANRIAAALAVLSLSLAGCRDRDLSLTVIDPGHFHASLLQKNMLEGVSPEVNVYAPEGPELQQYLSTVKSFCERKENPASWKENVYAGDDFLERLPEGHGNIAVLAGNNRLKSDYILTAVEKGYNVLSDKPLAIDKAGYEKLSGAYREAGRKGLVIYDLMTERYDILNILVREIVNDPDVFGSFDTSDGPAVKMTSVHHFYKEVAGSALTRPQWYYDVRQQGEGIADVTTHLIDLVFWQCFPDRPVTLDMVKVDSASHYPTVVTLEQFRKSTGAVTFPEYLSGVEKDGTVSVMANGSVSFTVDSLPVEMNVRWNWMPDEGQADTFEAVYKGTKASVIVFQNAKSRYVKSLAVDCGNRALNVDALARLMKKYPFVTLHYGCENNGADIIIPEENRPGHEEHFNMVAARMLKFVRGEESLPEWEVPNTLSKYYITTTAAAMAAGE